MSDLCQDCGTAPTAIGTATKQTAELSLGEIGKVYIQRKYSTGTTLNEIIVATANPNLKATWTALSGAADSTKVSFSPIVHAPEFTLGDKNEHGGVGVRQGGKTQDLGSNPSKVKLLAYGITATIEAELKLLACESDLVVFPIDECDNIWGKNEEGGTTKFYGLGIGASFSCSDRVINGKGNPDHWEIEFEFPSGYSANMIRVVPEAIFFPLTDFPV